MKKTVRFLSLTMVFLMLMSLLSLNVFGFSNDYITIECPQNFDEDNWSMEDDSVVDVYYSEYKLAEDGEEYYTDNTVNIYATACWNDKLETYYDEETLDYLVEYNEYSAEIKSKTMYYTTFGGYDAVAYDVFYTYIGADENGKRVVEDHLYSEVIVVTDRVCITMDFEVSEADDLLLYRNEMAELFLKGISINAENVAKVETEEKIIAAVIVCVLSVGIIAIVVAIIKPSKKKKNSYPYNTNIPPQYYNPYAQMPYGNQQRNNPVETSPYVQSSVNVSTDEINKEDSK